MNTTDIASLCPYTGLRSFTEEESIYFKGRDTQIDQITEQLSARKFLMLTGASGDGKSSLIYAGLVPQARSGFFKAKFTNWTVVDFRPERSPLKNLIHAIAGAFTVEASTIETELSRGFSSLTDIYLNSEFYPDYNIGGVGGSDADHRQQLRKASNLMVIVDQFEEFFTNPENNDGEVPNQSSQIVVNLMLETARIALERSLPIYVVFTMRSDYIGQCSAFRGLPEFIGYSQFFVPRLTRGELKQVIEEPAQLNGNTISNRLTERLIYDLNEGIDQLPILQHALSQIWRVANAGREEMDLIHYSMVGGLSADELPAADKHRFKAWLTSLPENQRQHYAEAGLDKVIEIHARKLYDDAADHYASIENSVALHTRTVKNCIAIAFACLTKIDNGRAVRNRMSLTEIAQVINQPEVTPQVLGKILEIFRLPDNSFIRPFVFADNSETLPDTVLDITHESLIRNWSMLKRWANQEFAFYTTFEDLRKQIARWKVHHKSKGYLIPIGPLTYFEGWYAECKPNAAWIRRYIDKSGNAETDRQLSVNLLEDINTYLAQSAKNVALSRLLIKYGAGKIAGIVALAAVAVLAIYFVFDIYRKKSSTVIEQVKTEGRQLLKSGDVGFEHKAAYLITEERLVPGSALELLRGMPQIEQLSINYDIWRLLYPSRRFHRTQFSTQLVDHLDKQLRSDSFKTLPVARALQARVAFSLMSSYENYYGPENIKRAWVTENAAALFPLIIENFKREPASGSQTSLINHGIQHWLTFGQATPAQIDQLIGLISPLDSTSRFNLFYKRGGLEPDGYRPLDFGGGYHVLASLYAAKGDIAKVLWTFEQQLGSEDYFTDRLFNTRSNVLGYLYQYGHHDLVAHAIAWHTKHFPEIPAHQILVDVINRSGYMSELERVNLNYRNETTELGTFTLNLCLSDREQYKLVLADYEAAVNQLADQKEREFLLAMHFKRTGMYSERYHRERGLENKDNIDALFDKSLSHFNTLSETDQQLPVTYRFYYLFGTRTRTWTRRQLFAFPDIHGSWQAAPKHGDAFFLYLAKKNLLQDVYKTTSDLSLVPFWVITMRERFRSVILSNEALQAALDLVTTHPAGRGIDMNLVKIELARGYLKAGDTTKGNAVARQIDIPLLEASRARYALQENTAFLNELMALSGDLAAVGEVSQVAKLTNGFSNPESKVLVYLHSVEKARMAGRPDVAKIMLDSASSLAAGIDEPTLSLWFFYSDKYNMAASYVGDKAAIAQGVEMLRNTPENLRFSVYLRRFTGIARKDELYNAVKSLPGNFTESQDMAIRTTLLDIAAELQEGRNVSELGMALGDMYFAQQAFVLFNGQ